MQEDACFLAAIGVMLAVAIRIVVAKVHLKELWSLSSDFDPLRRVWCDTYQVLNYFRVGIFQACLPLLCWEVFSLFVGREADTPKCARVTHLIIDLLTKTTQLDRFF